MHGSGLSRLEYAAQDQGFCGLIFACFAKSKKEVQELRHYSMSSFARPVRFHPFFRHRGDAIGLKPLLFRPWTLTRLKETTLLLHVVSLCVFCCVKFVLRCIRLCLCLGQPKRRPSPVGNGQGLFVCLYLV